MRKIKDNKYTNFNSKKEAFQYQKDAFESIKDLNYSAVFHEQGLGKTKIAVDLLLYWLTEREIDTVLIVTKKQLVNNWKEEIEYHTHLKSEILSNDRRNNFYIFNSPSKVILTNFETIVSEIGRFELFLKSRNVAIIIDESTKLKNPDAKITQVFFDIKDLFKIRVIMTGTPVANRPYDIWSQIFFLDGGKSLGENFLEFKKYADLTNNLGKNDVLTRQFEQGISSVNSKISDFTVRETKDSCGIDLPNKVYRTINVDMKNKQLSTYQRLLKSLQVEIKKEGRKELEDNGLALKKLLRLMQITSNPRLLNDDYIECSSKETELYRLIKSIDNNGEKCIVWTNFIDNIDYFLERLKKYNPVAIHGSMSMKDRNKSVEIFKSNSTCKVLLATPQAAKEGLTLTVANNVIFYDQGYNLDDYLQAQDRIHRISQTKTCYIYNIVCNNSVDEWIVKLLDAKQNAAALTQGDTDLKSYKEVVNYSYSDIIKEILFYEGENNGL